MTKAKKAEEALRESEERYRRIVSAVTDYIFTVDVENGRAVRTVHGPACVALTGYTAEEFAADPYLWFRMVFDEDREKVQRHAERILPGEDPGAIEHRLWRKDGTVRWVRNTPVLHRNDSGALTSYDGLISDITDRREAEAELRKAKNEIESWNVELENRIKEKTKELEKSQAMLFQAEKLSAMGRLAGGLAHELNTPLAGLLPMLEKYREKSAGDAEAYKEIDLMFKACRHMAEIVKDFSAFSRTPQGEIQSVNLNELIEATLSFSIQQLLKMGIKVNTFYTEELPNIPGKTTELQQVILNMITNARDAMPDGGELTIKTEYSEDKNNVIMEFNDNGMGIEQENLTKIFDPFFTTKKTGHGVGLGLSVSYGIIKNHNGEIVVESEPGKGSRFKIFLPVH
ncbi:MAG: PAS domain S-box protein [Nitrospirae bacterium]|nr:PAS domain S-box protein [Nitrospirota bacterium]